MGYPIGSNITMKYTNKNNPIAKQLGNNKYRNRIVTNKKHHNKGARIEDWEDAETEQDIVTNQELQSEHKD